MDLLMHMAVTTSIDEGNDAEKSPRQQHAVRACELSDQGILLRSWRAPEHRENGGIGKAADSEALHDALASLPLFKDLKNTVSAFAVRPDGTTSRSKIGETR